jgi:putative transposase
MTELLRGDELYDTRLKQVVMQVTNPTLAMGRIQVLEVNADTERRIDYEELRQQLASGSLEVRRKSNFRRGTHRPGARFLDHSDPTTRKRLGRRCAASKKAQENYCISSERARRVVNAIADYCKRYAVSAYAAYHPVCEQFTSHHPELEFPSLSTVYRLLERQRCGAHLVIGNDARGNKDDRHTQAMVDLICELAEKTFLEEGSKWTLKSLTELVKHQARVREVQGWKKPPSRKFIRKTIVTQLHAMPEVARMLAKDRSAQSSIASHRLRVEGLLQRVEQDTLDLPFDVMTDDGPCSDVYLTHAIDCASSHVTGWHLKIGAPNESDGLRCVESTLFPKKESFKRFGIEGSHDLFGAPMLLVLDNGPEGKGDRFRRLGQIGTEPGYCKARQPQTKPFVERLNRSLKAALETLPGSTRMNGMDGARDAVALGDQLMSLEELERWIVNWYFNDWADTVLERFVDEEVSEGRGLGVTPRERLANLLERVGQPLPPPPNRSDWIRTKYDVVIRTLSIKTGISVDGYDFKGKNLVGLIQRFGQARVEVFYDPEDYRRVYVDMDNDLVELTNASATEYSPAYTFAYAKEYRHELKKQHAETPRQTAFRVAVQERSLEGNKQKAQPKKSPNRVEKKQVVQKTAQRDAVKRAAQNPLPPSKAKTACSTDSMPIQWDDAGELPTRDRKTGTFV